MSVISEIDSFPEKFYEVVWRPQAHSTLIFDYIPSPALIYQDLLLELARLLHESDLAEYEKSFHDLEELSIVYVLAAFCKLGWKWEVGQRFSKNQMVSALGIINQHLQLLERFLDMLSEEGILRRCGDLWEVERIPEFQDPDELAGSLSSPEPRPEVRLLKHCGPRLPEALLGKCSALELLFPEGDFAPLSDLYQNSPMLQMNSLLKRAVLTVLEHLPPGHRCRILEIGAGTGGTTSHLLPHLPPSRVEYVFTDVARVFLHKAKTRFQNYPFMRYRLLNIEQKPILQKDEPDRYDIIVAVNVLHATKDLAQTLDHIRLLLHPGGMLLLLEGTAPARWVDLVFGATEGWWRFADHHLRPSYPLISAIQWETLLKEHGFGAVVSISPNEAHELGITSSRPVLHPNALLVAQATPMNPGALSERNWLILADGQGIGRRLKERIVSSRERCYLVFPGEAYEQVSEGEFRVDPSRPEDFHRLMRVLPHPLSGVVHLWSLDIPQLHTGDDSYGSYNDMLDRASLLSCGSTLHLLQAMADQEASLLCLVTRGAQPVGAEATMPGIAQSPLWGMGKIIALERPDLNCLRLDLDPQDPGKEDQVIFQEMDCITLEDQVAWRNGQRYVARLVHHQSVSSGEASPKTGTARPGEMICRGDAGYLITGGWGGLGLVTARWLVDHGARCLILMNRHAPDPEARSQIQELEESEVQIVLVQGDVSDAGQLSKMFADIDRALPPLRGIIHTAGVIDDDLLQQLDWERFTAVMAPKVKGAWLLHAMTASPRFSLDFFILFSSAITMLSNLGQTNYAAANAFLDGLAHYRRSRGLPGLTINWGPWSETGMLKRYPTATRWLELLGISTLSPQRGLMILDDLLSRSSAQIGVMAIDWPVFLEQYGLRNKPFFADFVPDYLNP